MSWWDPRSYGLGREVANAGNRVQDTAQAVSDADPSAYVAGELRDAGNRVQEQAMAPIDAARRGRDKLVTAAKWTAGAALLGGAALATAGAARVLR